MYIYDATEVPFDFISSLFDRAVDPDEFARIVRANISWKFLLHEILSERILINIRFTTTALVTLIINIPGCIGIIAVHT